MDDDTTTIEHDTETGIISITFERFETSDDIVLPNFKVAVSTSEHLLGWIESLLIACKRRCRQIKGKFSEKRFQTTLRATRSDRDLVYLGGAQRRVIVIRSGRVLKIQFAVEPMPVFMQRLGEENYDTSNNKNTSTEFSAFVKGLMR